MERSFFQLSCNVTPLAAITVNIIATKGSSRLIWPDCFVRRKLKRRLIPFALLKDGKASPAEFPRKLFRLETRAVIIFAQIIVEATIISYVLFHH